MSGGSGQSVASGVVPPRNAWWRRDADGTNATFGCTGRSLPVHRMTCVGTDWHSDTTPDATDCPDPPLIGIDSSYSTFYTSWSFLAATFTSIAAVHKILCS